MDKKLMNLLGVWLFAVASVCALTACSDNDTENPEGEKTGGENGKPTPETVEFINSNLVYWGDEDGVGTDHFVLTLYTDMEVDAAGNPIGPGKIMAFSLNVPPFASGTTEFPLPERTFDAAPNGYTFNEWTFNLGYMNQMDLPTGKVEVPAGSFYGDVKAHSTSVDADLLSGGKMTVKRSADGEYTISGVLVGDLSLKRYFTYTGKLTTIDRHGSTEEIPNSTLNADLTLNEWAQARLQDKADFYYLQDESCRVLELYLAEEGGRTCRNMADGQRKSAEGGIFCRMGYGCDTRYSGWYV